MTADPASGADEVEAEAPGAGRLPGGLDGELVAVADGPLVGQWFTWADWQTRLRAAQNMADRGQRRSPVLDYRPAGYQIPHPDPSVIGVRGWVATTEFTPIEDLDQDDVYDVAG